MHVKIQGRVKIQEILDVRDPFTERFRSLLSKPLNLFAVPNSITSGFSFLRLMFVRSF